MRLVRCLSTAAAGVYTGGMRTPAMGSDGTNENAMPGKGDPSDDRPGRRMRFDRSEAVEGRGTPVPAPKGTLAVRGDRGLGSGRVFVTGVVVGVLVLWGSLFVSFRGWRSRYHERAAFGARFVAAGVDPLAKIVPADESPVGVRALVCAGASALASASPLDVSPAAWRKAVEQTHEMLVALTAANLLDTAQMHELGVRIAERVARAGPKTARAELTELWDEVEFGSGSIISARHPRPDLLPRWKPKGLRWADVRR